MRSHPLCPDCAWILTRLISLTRQNLPQLAASSIEIAGKGGYIARDTTKKADLTFVASGSEVSIALEAADILAKAGREVRVVSLPCWEVFDKQTKEYQLSVFPDGAPVISVEAYTTMGCENIFLSNPPPIN